MRNLAARRPTDGSRQGSRNIAHQFDEYTVWSRLIDDFLTPARDRYGPERWDLAERAGAALTVSETIDLALAQERFASPASAATA